MNKVLLLAFACLAWGVHYGTQIEGRNELTESQLSAIAGGSCFDFHYIGDCDGERVHLVKGIEQCPGTLPDYAAYGDGPYGWFRLTICNTPCNLDCGSYISQYSECY